jgi:hypothetical protein
VADPAGLGWTAGQAKQAQAILVAALEMLAAHFGYGEARQAS